MYRFLLIHINFEFRILHFTKYLTAPVNYTN